jgi:uncharacterized protein
LARNIYLDTGPLVAIINKRDQYHYWATDQIANIMDKDLTTNPAVLCEAFHLLKKTNKGMHGLLLLLEEELLKVENPYPKEKKYIHKTLRNYQNIRASFTDICLIAMANRASDSLIFTTDSDFSIYRDSRGKPFNLISPY